MKSNYGIDHKKFEGDLLYLMQEVEKYILQNIHIGMTIDGLYRNDLIPHFVGELTGGIKEVYNFIKII